MRIYWFLRRSVSLLLGFVFSFFAMAALGGSPFYLFTTDIPSQTNIGWFEIGRSSVLDSGMHSNNPAVVHISYLYASDHFYDSEAPTIPVLKKLLIPNVEFLEQDFTDECKSQIRWLMHRIQETLEVYKVDALPSEKGNKTMLTIDSSDGKILMIRGESREHIIFFQEQIIEALGNILLSDKSREAVTLLNNNKRAINNDSFQYETVTFNEFSYLSSLHDFNSFLEKEPLWMILCNQGTEKLTSHLIEEALQRPAGRYTLLALKRISGSNTVAKKQVLMGEGGGDALGTKWLYIERPSEASTALHENIKRLFYYRAVEDTDSEHYRKALAEVFYALSCLYLL